MHNLLKYLVSTIKTKIKAIVKDSSHKENEHKIRIPFRKKKTL